VRAAGRLAPNVDRPLPSPTATFASPRFRLHSGGDIQGPNQIFQSVRRHGHSNGEKNKRGDDHSDSNCSEPTSEPAFGFFRMSDRDILDQGSDHVATGSRQLPPILQPEVPSDPSSKIVILVSGSAGVRPFSTTIGTDLGEKIRPTQLRRRLQHVVSLILRFLHAGPPNHRKRPS